MLLCTITLDISISRKEINRNVYFHFQEMPRYRQRNLDRNPWLIHSLLLQQRSEQCPAMVDQAKKLEPRLNKGMDGIAELEKAGYSFTDKKKITLKKLFTELK